MQLHKYIFLQLCNYAKEYLCFLGNLTDNSIHVSSCNYFINQSFIIIVEARTARV